ncbi:MAG: adenosine kinase [archaeon]
MNYDVYGIGNPLMDINVFASDSDIAALGLVKGSMNLIDLNKKKSINSYIKNKGLKTVMYPAGDCPNTIMGVAALGGTAVLGGKVGIDSESEVYIKQIKELGVYSDIKKGEGLTGSSNIFVTPDSQRTMATFLGNCQKFSKADVDEEIIKNTKFLYVTGYMWDTISQKEATLIAFSLAKKYNVKVVFNLADHFLVKRNIDAFPEIIKKNVDILIANNLEAKEISGELNLSELCKINIITYGENGSILTDNSKKEKISAYPVNAKDTTGAGDMYAAGFLFGLSKGYSLKDAATLGSYFASRIVQKNGAFITQEIKTEVINFRNKLRPI